MKVLVTGANGFIGKNLVKRLLDCDIGVYVYVKNNWDNRLRVDKVFKGNILDLNTLDKIDWKSIDIVINLIASGVKAHNRNLNDCINVNIIGTLNILDSINRSGYSPYFMSATTFYENCVSKNISLQSNPYILTKRISSQLIKNWAQRNNKSGCFLNFFQVFGADDDPRNVLSYALKQFKSGNIAKFGSGTIRRDWIYIKHSIDQIISIINFSHKPGFQEYDIGTGNLFSLRKIVEKLAYMCGVDTTLLDFSKDRDRNDLDVEVFAKNIKDTVRNNWNLENSLNDFINEFDSLHNVQ